MITLKDLKEYDIKNVDIGKFIKSIQQRKDVLANIAIVVITLMTLNNLTSREKIQVRNSKQEITVLEKKIKAISEHGKSKKELDTLIKSLPQGLPEADSIIQEINGFAIDHSVQILSFMPRGRTENDLYNRVNLKLIVTCQNYENLTRFIQDIENSPNNIRIENWSARIERKQNKNLKAVTITEEIQPPIRAELELTSICFKYEK